jgi:hypothetical protein
MSVAALAMGRREKRLLVVLVVIGTLFAVSRLGSLFGPGDGGGPGGSGGGPAGAGAVPERVVELETERLTADPRDYSPGRDPFRYEQPPPPPPPPGPTAEELAAQEAERLRRLAEQQRQRELDAEQAAIPRPPELTLSYLGSFGTESRKIAVFTDGDDIYNVLEGEVLDGEFIVDRIGLESVDIRYVNFPDEPPTRLAAGS